MKIKLTKQEMKTLENVFNYAISYLEEQAGQGVMFTIKEDGTAEKFDTDKEYKNIESLFNLINDNLELKEE
jgi:lysyl-tRNA synthetase class I